jgi:hypothetical protein
MKEAIANAGVFNLIIIFVIVLLAFFIGSLSYSKAFKAKNKIVEEIEKDQGFNDDTQEQIENWLAGIGYRSFAGGNNVAGCEATAAGNGGAVGTLVRVNSNYQYCVYEFNTCGDNADTLKCGVYYRVITYMYFDVPIITGYIKVPMKSETLTFNTTNDTTHLGHVLPTT